MASLHTLGAKAKALSKIATLMSCSMVLPLENVVMVALNGRQKDVALVHTVSADGADILVCVLILEPVLSRLRRAKHKNKFAVLDESMSEDVSHMLLLVLN